MKFAPLFLYVKTQPIHPFSTNKSSGIYQRIISFGFAID